MVAGMVMYLADLRAIYELLFRDGVVVAKNDKRPQSMHPDIKVVSNLKVIRAMGSLKSKGYVRETFVWKHAYYYLTNEGTLFLRDYLHLPPEIMPAPLQRVHCPASSAWVQTVKGPSSYMPKSKPEREHQEAMMDGCIYGDNRIGKERKQSARPLKNKVGKDGVQNLIFNGKAKHFCKGDEHGAKRGDKKNFGASYLCAEERTDRSSVSFMETKVPASCVHDSCSVVPAMPKEVSTVQTAPCTPFKEVLHKCLKVTAADQPLDFKESECVQMQKAIIKYVTDEFNPDVMGEKTFNRSLEVPGEVEPGEHLVVKCQTVPLMAELTDEEEQLGVLKKADVVIRDTVEKLPHDAEMMKQLNMTNSKTSESVRDHDSATHLLKATDSFKNLTKESVVDYDIAGVEDTQKVLEKAILTQVIYQLHVASETSSSTDIDTVCPIPIYPSECLIGAPKTPLLQGDLDLFTEVLEKEQDVHRIWPDFQEGLSLSLFFSSSSVSSSFCLQ